MELGEHARAAFWWGAASSARRAPTREAAELRGLCAEIFGLLPPYSLGRNPGEEAAKICQDFCSVGTVQELLVLKSLYPVSGNLVSSGDEPAPKLQLPESREGLWLVSQGWGWKLGMQGLDSGLITCRAARMKEM